MENDEMDSDLNLGTEKPEGSKKKLIIIIVLAALLLLAVGGGVAWFLLGDSKPGSEQAEGGVEDKEKVVDNADNPALYHPLEPVFVVNLPPGGRHTMMQVGVHLMTREPDLVEFLEYNNPLIRDQLLTLFSNQKDTDLQDRKGKEKLQAKMKKVLNKIVADQGGTGEIEGVYFTSFVMQ